MKGFTKSKLMAAFTLFAVILISPMLAPVAEACPRTTTIFYDNFNGRSLSPQWNYKYIATGGSMKVSSSQLHFVSPSIFQDAPNSHDVLRRFISPSATLSKMDISVRLRVNSFDRFSITIDHAQTNSYPFENLMFNLNLREAGVPPTNNILTIGTPSGELGGGPGIEGSMIDSLAVGTWYVCKISIQRSPYLVTFTIFSDGGVLLAQQQVAGSALSAYGFNDIKAVGFNSWTSLASGPYGNVDIDWVKITN
ncbi:MAG: hypothetical protein NTV61_04575 [Candidatus Bathyarchaeota archaeon]|nr:hypothetical protein [Candidatus Bathyarchaeota archaeon]